MRLLINEVSMYFSFLNQNKKVKNSKVQTQTNMNDMP